MKKDENFKANKVYRKAITNVENLVIFLNKFIKKHGKVKAVRNNFSGELIDAYHDYIYYCFTKSSRSIYSSFILEKENLREDALIIMRTVYENYLRISFTLKNPMIINEFVIQEIGLRTGDFIYKSRHNGTKDFSKVVNIWTNEEFNHGTKISIMARESINSADKELHKIIYQYLSEHTHPNMIASGNYRSNNSKDYVLFSKEKHLELTFFINYLSFLTIDAIHYYHTNLSDWNLENISTNEVLQLEFIIEKTKRTIVELIENLDFTEIGDGFKENVEKRINKANIK